MTWGWSQNGTLILQATAVRISPFLLNTLATQRPCWLSCLIVAVSVPLQNTPMLTWSATRS